MNHALGRNVLIIFLIFFSSFLTAQKATISGYIEDANSGEKLIGVNIFDQVNKQGVSSNTYGFFSLTLPTDSVDLFISYVGYQAGRLTFKLQQDTSINIALVSGEQLEEIVVSADAEEKIEDRTQMSAIDIPIAQIKKVPALLGEVDVLKALQLLPGVQSGGEGQSGLYVRGGSPDQNLILLDGVPVYNASHLFGFFSVFNADALRNVKLIKGGYPARYGGRLSSILDISMKEGNNQEFHGAGSIGLISSKLTLEGPLIKDKTSFIVSARRTYLDVVARPFIKRSYKKRNKDGIVGYYFYDLNAKVNHSFSDSDKLYLSFYGGNDKFYLRTKDLQGDSRENFDSGLGWGNITTALRWNHVWNPKLFSNTTVTYSQYNLDVANSIENTYTQQNLSRVSKFSLDYISGINDWAAKVDFDYIPNTYHTLRFGVHGIRHTFKPGDFNLFQKDNRDEQKFSFGQKNVEANEFSTYIEDDVELSDRFKVNAGLHFSAFQVNKKTYTSLQPRLSMRYKLPSNLSLKASFATMRQYINLLSFDGIGLPTDLWLPATENLKPQDSWQAAVGAGKSYGDYEVSVEAYYKSMKNLLSYKEGNGLFETSDWQTRVTQGNGESYGAEFFAQKKKGKFNGWVGYTLSWTNRQFEELNFGRKYPYRYDRRHDISVVANYDWTDKISFSGAWVYGTGNAISLGHTSYEGSYYDGIFRTNYQVNDYENRNGFRMPHYHRVDLSVSFKKKTKWGNRTWSFGAYNVYSRSNPFFLYTTNSYIQDSNTGVATKSIVLRQASLFPIVPFVSYSFEF